MISRRRGRGSQPQENLKQFSLNASRGVDETKPITDSSTVLDMKNLTVNDDGSVSLRKRMLAVNPAPVGPKVHLMHTGEHFIKCGSGINIVRRDNGAPCELSVKGTKYYDRSEVTLPVETAPPAEDTPPAESTLPNVTLYDNNSIDTSNATFLNTADGTILGNCTISSRIASAYGLVDSSLFDTNGQGVITQQYLPRYLKISETAENTFEILIITPEINTLTTAEGEVSLNPNMTLDNPYAIRDTYGSEVVQVSGIIPYNLPEEVNVVSRAVNTDVTELSKSFKSNVEGEHNPDGSALIIRGMSLNDIQVSDKASGGGKFYSFNIPPSFNVALRLYAVDDTVYLSYTFATQPPSNLLNNLASEGESPYDLEIAITFGSVEYGNGTHVQPMLTNLVTYAEDDTVPAKYSIIESRTCTVRLNAYEGSGERVLSLQGAKNEDETLVGAPEVSPAYALRRYIARKYGEDKVQNYKLAVMHVAVKYSNAYTLSKVPSSDNPDTDVVEGNGLASVSVPSITENNKALSPKAFSVISNNFTGGVLLKAFCKFPKASGLYCKWEYSLDGVSWNPYGDILTLPNQVVLSVPDSKVSTHIVETHLINRLPQAQVGDYVTTRPDVLYLQAVQALLPDTLSPLDMVYRFRIFSIVSETPVDASNIKGTLGSDIAYFETRIPTGPSTEYLKTDMPNAVLGEKLYYKKSIYSFGTTEYDTFAYKSDAGSFITPLYNILELDANAQDTVCAIVPWRDYLITCTEKSMYLSSRSDSGFFTKTISTSVGVPFKDRKCVKPALNGIILKSGYDVYFAYPNMYASDDTTLNLTNISRPVSHIFDEVLTSNVECFAEVVDDKYVLMVPKDEVTVCLCYDLNTRLWEHYEYPRVFNKFVKDAAKGTSVLSTSSDGFEYIIFDDDYSRRDPARNAKLPVRYEDVLSLTEEDGTYSDGSPIVYHWDTGQKTDSILHTKQFVESKLVFATLDDKDTFPFTAYVAIDGDPHVTRLDVSTDAPFWKSGLNDAGVAGTAFKLSYGGDDPHHIYSTHNVLRQYVIRYSGKGKSIRHCIEGDSYCNFKLYEAYVRYKNLNIKQ